MKYQVRIGPRTYAVDIEDLNKRPIVARVDGEAFEVEPEDAMSLPAAEPAAAVPPAVAPVAVPASPAPGAAPAPRAVPTAAGSRFLVSPLPGTIVELYAKAGDEVEAGASLCVIEAMKMKNTIRSIRAGRVKAVMVSQGQTVAHKQPLLEFDA